MPPTKPPYTSEFRREAVQLVKNTDRSIAQVARDLGVSNQTLRNWIKQTDVDAGRREGLTTDEREELRRLRRDSFVSLLIHEGRSVVDVARQAGHSPTMTLDVYAHVFDEFDIAERVSARGSDRPGATRCVRIVSARRGRWGGGAGNAC